MSPLVRSLLAVLAGVLTSVLVVLAGDALVHRLYAFPTGGTAQTREAVRTMPAGAFAVALAGWVAAAAAGALVAARLAHRRPVGHGVTVALVLLGATVVNLALISHPSWVSAGALVGIPAAGWAASRMVHPRGTVRP
ncbi:MAG TPA: hypothetical protein VF576_08410 [Rubricoccaceae bacterium]|jgi:hypothetical protein